MLEGRWKPNRGPRDVSQIEWFTSGEAGEHIRRYAKAGGIANGLKKIASVDDLAFAINRQYNNYARGKGPWFTLTRDEFALLVIRECWYCGGPPAQTWRRHGAACPPVNGVDRLDNSKGYVADNVVACCGPCNRAKHTQSVSEFLDRVSKIYERHKSNVSSHASA